MSTIWQGQLNDRSEDYEYHNLGARLVAPVDPAATTAPPAPAWGCLIHPDELRHVLLVGNSLLVTVNGEQLTDFQLKNWVDMNVQAFGQKLNYDIYPRLFRARYLHNQDREIEDFAEWDDPYEYDGNRNNKNFQLKLRRKNIARVINWSARSPFDGHEVINLTKYILPQYKTGILKASLYNTGSYAGFQGIPIAAWRAANYLTNLTMYVDYVSGYDRASRVPQELRKVIIDQMVIDVMSAYGEGIVSGLSSSSVSVGVLSESIGTTQSATSAWFGARIMQLQKGIDDWFKTRAHAYRGISFRAM
jgi:hypothetical protein